MKAGLSNIWLLGMIAIFIFLFSCYVIISISYTKSFKMKNEMLTIIERGKGITGLNGSGGVKSWTSGKVVPSSVKSGASMVIDVGSFRTMNLYLLGNSYSAQGQCPDGSEDNVEAKHCWYGVINAAKDTYEEVRPGQKYDYCFAKYGVPTNVPGDSQYNQYYYKIRVFYKMEFPVLSDFLSVKVDGRTNSISDVQDMNSLKTCT